MQDELHATGLIEKAFGDNRTLRRERAQLRCTGSNVNGCLLCARFVEAAFVHQKRRHRLGVGDNAFADMRYFGG
jgi:hypothetical protein